MGGRGEPGRGDPPEGLGGAGQPLAGVTLPTGGIYSVRGSQGSDGVAVDGPVAGGQIVAASASQRSAVDGVDAGQLSAGATGASARNVGATGNAYLATLLGHAPSATTSSKPTRVSSTTASSSAAITCSTSSAWTRRER